MQPSVLPLKKRHACLSTHVNHTGLDAAHLGRLEMDALNALTQMRALCRQPTKAVKAAKAGVAHEPATTPKRVRWAKPEAPTRRRRPRTQPPIWSPAPDVTHRGRQTVS